MLDGASSCKTDARQTLRANPRRLGEDIKWGSAAREPGPRLLSRDPVKLSGLVPRKLDHDTSTS